MSAQAPEQLTFSLEAPPASPSRSLDSEREWMTLVATWPSSFSGLLIEHGPAGWYGRTSLVSCQAITDGILEPSSGHWENSGMGGPTESWTLSTSEFPSDGDASSLSDILETGTVPPRFYLSAKACQGILRRAERRGKAPPERLREALALVAGLTPATATEGDS